jgi:sugar lactone lactonase YvrE
MLRQINIIRDVILHPASAFKEISLTENKFFKIGFGLLAFSIIFETIREIGWGSDSLSNFSGSSTVVEISGILLIYYIGRKLDGKGSFFGVLSVLGYASIPQIIGFVVVPIVVVFASLANVSDVMVPDHVSVDDFFVLPSYNNYSDFFQFIWLSLLSYGFLIWALILGIIAVKEIHRFTIAKSIITIVISLLIGLVIFGILIVGAVLVYSPLVSSTLTDTDEIVSLDSKREELETKYPCGQKTLPHPISYINDQPTFVKTWGSFGKEGGQFGYLQDIAVDSIGNVYVTDSGAVDEIYRVQKFTSDGQYITEWGSKGTGNGQFIGPRGIVIDSENNIYVADKQNFRIQKFSSDGKFITKWDSPGDGFRKFGFISGLAVDSSDNIYVVDRSIDRIQKLSNEGEFITMWRLNFSDNQSTAPVDIAIDPFDYVYVVDSISNSIQKFDCNGNWITTWDSLGPEADSFRSTKLITIDSLGFIYITAPSSESQILQFNNDGEFLTKWGSKGSGDGQFIGAGNVAVDSMGNIYVIDETHGRIQKFSFNP